MQLLVHMVRWSVELRISTLNVGHDKFRKKGVKEVKSGLLKRGFEGALTCANNGGHGLPYDYWARSWQVTCNLPVFVKFATGNKHKRANLM